MAFDGIVTKAITEEFRNDLIGGKIDKVHQPNKNTIILGIYANSLHYALNVCIDAHNCRINLTTKSRVNPLVAPNFCMLLRKHLIGARISNISMFGLERLVKIELETINEFNEIELKTLIIELMGKHSNIILLNNKNIIIDALRHIEASDDNYRDILPSRVYTLPSSNKIDFTEIKSFDIFYNSFKNYSDLEELESQICNTFTGFSLSFVKYSIEHCKINSISKESLEILFNYFEAIIYKKANLAFEKLYKKDKISDFVLTTSQEMPQKLSLNYFLDDFYFERETTETFTNYRNSILKLILDLLRKYNNRLLSINSKLKDCDEMEKYKLYGELITANLYKLTNKHEDSIKLENYYDNNNLITIPLDKKYPPNINAKRYFKKYNKLKNALEIVTMQKVETEKELNYIESIVYELETATSLEDVQEIFEEISENVIFKNTIKNKKSGKAPKKKKKVEAKFNPLKFEVDGFEVFVGRNNKENDWLTLHFANKSDIWFHAKDIQGSHVILRNSGQNISDDTLVKCAIIAATHSKAKLSSNVPVDYCNIQYVKKPNSSKPGMVIFSNNKTLFVNPNM